MSSLTLLCYTALVPEPKEGQMNQPIRQERMRFPWAGLALGLLAWLIIGAIVLTVIYAV